jgi:hypothetical protein
MSTLFVTPSEVVNRMQINESLDGASEVLKSAILGAQLHISGKMPTNLELEAQDRVFFLDSEAFSGVAPGGALRVELPSYFIRSDPAHPITLTYGNSWLTAGDYPVDPNLYRVLHEDGHILIDEDVYGDKFLRVQCTTGFDPNAVLVPADPLADPPVEEERGVEAIPDWLKEAILGFVGVVLDVSQTTNRSAQAKDVYQRAGEHAMSVMASHLRTRAFVIRHLR